MKNEDNATYIQTFIDFLVDQVFGDYVCDPTDNERSVIEMIADKIARKQSFHQTRIGLERDIELQREEQRQTGVLFSGPLPECLPEPNPVEEMIISEEKGELMRRKLRIILELFKISVSNPYFNILSTQIRVLEEMANDILKASGYEL